MCIDCESRFMIWCRAVPSNRSPLVVANLFLVRCTTRRSSCHVLSVHHHITVLATVTQDAIEAFRMGPRFIRADHGSENRGMAIAQKYLRQLDADFDDQSCVILGPFFIYFGVCFAFFYGS